MKNKTIKVVSKEDLLILKTKQLLSRLNKLHKCENSYEYTDLFDCNIPNPDTNEEIILYKETKKWIDAYNDLKSELSKREHITKRDGAKLFVKSERLKK